MVAAIIPEQERRIDISVIISRCKEKLPSSLYYPNFFLILDVLPKTSTGKIQNGRLRELFDSGKYVVFAFNEFDNSGITA
jgi:acyl-coenzyme A synthetase/AMP-(fatty) acid ligase